MTSSIDRSCLEVRGRKTSTGRAQPSVALLTNAPAPYRTPFFNELAEHCRLLVLFETKSEPDREWAIDEQQFRFEWGLTRAMSVSPRRGNPSLVDRRVVHLPLNAFSLLNRFRPDVVISAELGARTASAAAYCSVHKRPLLVWWEGTPHSESKVGPLKTAVRKSLLRRAARAWANGGESARSLQDHGVPSSRIDLGMTGADTPHWYTEVEETRDSSRALVREQLGLEGVVLLFVGSLSVRKGLRNLLTALTLLSEDRNLPAWSALFVGSGPLSGEVDSWSRLHPSVPIALSGFVQPTELAKFFAAADVFVMPSLEDVWGMVCLEAVVAGLPQVTSSLAGAANELVTSREIGTIVDPRDTRKLADHLAHQIRVGPQRVPAALRGSATTRWSPSAMAERAVASIDASIRERR